MGVDIDQVLATEQVHAEDLMNSGNISWRLNVVFNLPGFNVGLPYVCYLKKYILTISLIWIWLEVDKNLNFKARPLVMKH